MNHCLSASVSGHSEPCGLCRALRSALTPGRRGSGAPRYAAGVEQAPYGHGGQVAAGRVSQDDEAPGVGVEGAGLPPGPLDGDHSVLYRSGERLSRGEAVGHRDQDTRDGVDEASNEPSDAATLPTTQPPPWKYTTTGNATEEGGR